DWSSDVCSSDLGLFGEGPLDHQGPRFRLHGAYNHPRPTARNDGSSRPPMWIGGKGGDRLLRLVAKHGAGWNSVWKWSPASFAERAYALRMAWAAQGRDPGSARISVGLYTLVGEDERDLVERFRALQRW